MPNGMMNDPNAMGGGTPMGQPPVGNPMGATAPPGAEAPMGGADDAVLDMHLTEDVKRALQAKGIDTTAVADRGPKEPVIVIPVSIIMQRYPAGSPEESMRLFVEEMTKGGQPTETEQVSAPTEMAAADTPMPSPEGLGAPTDRPPMVA